MRVIVVLFFFFAIGLAACGGNTSGLTGIRSAARAKPPYLHSPYPTANPSPTPPIRALLGVQLPGIGVTWASGTPSPCPWQCVYDAYFSPTVMNDIRNNLHADFIRTGWEPFWEQQDPVPWQHEDEVMDNACAAGLGVLVLTPVPGPSTSPSPQPSQGVLTANVQAFFQHYATRQNEAHCPIWAEVGNELDIPQFSFGPIDEVASFYVGYNQVIQQAWPSRVPVITGGAHTFNNSWISTLSTDIFQAPKGCNGVSPCSVPYGYGVHAYGPEPSQMYGDILSLESALASPDPQPLYMTEWASDDPSSLTQGIYALDSLYLVNIYQYKCQPNEGPNCLFGLVNNPPLYDAVQAAYEYICTNRVESWKCGDTPYDHIFPYPH